MFKLLLRVAMGLMLSLLGRSAWAVEQATIDQVVNVAKIGCLLGNEFTFDAKANGDITFAKLRPGAEAGLHTNIKEDPGAPGIIDQQLKLVASQQIRDCMKPYIEKLAELILGQASGNPITSANAAIALDLGDCPLQGAAIFTNEATKTQTFSCDCPAQPEIGGYMVGTSVYSLGDPICQSALHAGVITRGTASKVLLRWVPSPPVFKGSTQHGVQSSSSSTANSGGAFVMAPAK